MAERILRRPEVEARTGLSRSTRWRLEADGLFPHRRQISINSVGWLESELQEWIAARPRRGAAPIDEKSNAGPGATRARRSDADHALDTGH